MIELPDNHCYLVIRIFDEANGDKSTSIVACYNKLSKANARASDEMSAAFTQHPLSNESNRPRARLVEDRYFAFAEFDSSAGAMRGDRIEVKVKKLPVQQSLRNASIEIIPKRAANNKRSRSKLGAELRIDEGTRTEETQRFPATIVPNFLPRPSEASILATRRRVESEINAVPVEGYLSKYEYYRPRQEDIDGLLSSTNTANTFLGATLRFYQTKRMEVAAAAVAATATSKVRQSPINTPPVSPLTDQEMSDRPVNEAISSLCSPPHEKENVPESPVSPLSLNDRGHFNFRPSVEDIERLLADSSFETGLSRSLTMSPSPNSYAKTTPPSAMPLTPPGSRRSSKVAELNTQQHVSSPRENRFLRPRTPLSPRRTHGSSPKRNRPSRRTRSSLSPTSPKIGWVRDVKTQANTKVNRRKSPVRRAKRRPRDSLDVSSFESHLLTPEVAETQARPMKIDHPFQHEPPLMINTSSKYVPGVASQNRRQRPVEGPETPSNLHAAKVAKTLETANQRGSCTTFSVGLLTDSMAGLSAEKPMLCHGKTRKARTRGTISRSRGGHFGTLPVTHIL